ncbi:MAG: hypothetical protein K0A89_04400 [ANME-2 cluster archaeon]|nr:hypothetical protein [ANME-2 cluster archaeon]
MNGKKNVIIGIAVILLLMLTLGCVDEYDVKPYEHVRKPAVAPAEESDINDDKTDETTFISKNTTSLTPIVVETYDDEQFIAWTLDSMSSIRSQTTINMRTGNWGKTLKEYVEDDQLKVKGFHVSPENQIIVEQYEHALEAYRLAGYYAEYDPTRTDFSKMDEALTCLEYGEFQFGIMETLLRPDTMPVNEPAEYISQFSLNRFSLPMDIIIPAGTTIKWQNRELKKSHRYLISEDGFWEEPIDISYMRYHEYTFNETGTFSFSLKSSEIPDTQTITVV